MSTSYTAMACAYSPQCKRGGCCLAVETVIFECAEAVPLLSSAAELRLHTAEFVNAFSSIARAAHVQAKRDGMRHAMHAACVQCAARQAVCARRVGTNRGMAKKETIRRSDCMIARERAQRRCVVEGRSRGAGSPVPCLFECLFRWTQAPSVWGAAPKRFRMSVTQQTRHKGRTR